ncbi:MAG: hypothetical protein ABR514_11005 [Chthoniobacterales bacterium]
MKNKIDIRQPRGRGDDRTQQQNLSNKWRELLGRRQPRHDPMLVFNMSIFNFEGGWNRAFNALNVRETVG